MFEYVGWISSVYIVGCGSTLFGSVVVLECWSVGVLELFECLSVFECV